MFSTKRIIDRHASIDQDKLKEFYPEEKARYVNNCLKTKTKVLEEKLKKEEIYKEEK